jgi:23S rRNA (cytosine1962-C5)-methyltransferase
MTPVTYDPPGLDCLSHLPTPSEVRIALRVTPAAERALRGGHPWLFDRAIQEQSHQGQPGDLAVVFDHQRKFLAIGLYDPLAPIRVRVLQHRHPAVIDPDFFAARLRKAAEIRAALPANTTAYRLVHGENDRLPGLVIDRYAETLVIKLYTAAWIPHLQGLLPALMQVFPTERLVLRLGRAVQAHPQVLYGCQDGDLLCGAPSTGPVLFLENGLRFEADPRHGHKTGFYLDQRDNRARVETLSAGKTVLNTFAYTGGFGVYAARGGARSVTDVDLSQPALVVARRNFAHNQDYPAVRACQHETILGDAFEVLGTLASKGRQFDLVILDPPSFAKSQVEIQGAIAAYQRLTQLGLALLSPGGAFVQASCSSRVSLEGFLEAVKAAAQQVKRPLRDIESYAHPLDHPVGFQEGAYLKCLFGRA